MVNRKLTAALAALAITTTAPVTQAQDGDGPRVAMVTSESGLGDRSFNDMMVKGMERAEQELGAEYVVIQPRAVSEFQSSLARAAGQGFDIIIGSSFDMIEPMRTVAEAFPEQKFGLVDVSEEPVADNVVSTVTRDYEGSALVGYIAAKTTETGTIGFVGGADIPIIHRFFVGYYYGAKLADPDVEVIETYSGSFNDPAAGAEYTVSNVEQGADINFAVAGATSAGVIDAAESTGTFSIGVDSNQNYMAPGSVLTSMVKRVDNQTYDMIESVANGTFEGGVVKSYGLAEEGVSYAMDEYNEGLISEEVVEKANELQQRVLAGDVEVPNYFNLEPGQQMMGNPPIETPPSVANATSLAQ